MSSQVVRVGIVECHSLLREAIRTLLNDSGEVLVVGEARGDGDVLAMVTDVKPEALLLVMDGDGQHEFSLLSLLPEIADRTNVLVATADDDAALHVHAIELGARGAVMLDQSSQLLIKALRKVCEGEVWLDRVRTAGMV